MQIRAFTLVRRGLLVATACCVPIGIFTGVPAGFANALGEIGRDTQLPLETLAVEQVDAGLEVAAPVRRPGAASLWQSRDTSSIRDDVRAGRERTPGLVRSIRFEDFKHWT